LENTERSVERGTFGSRTFFVGDEIFFGKDRLRDVEKCSGPRDRRPGNDHTLNKRLMRCRPRTKLAASAMIIRADQCRLFRADPPRPTGRHLSLCPVSAPGSRLAAEVAQRIMEAVFRAMGKAIPERLFAAPAGTSGNFGMSPITIDE